MDPSSFSIAVVFFIGAGCFALAALFGLAALVRILTSGGARTGLGVAFIAILISILGGGVAALSFAFLLSGGTPRGNARNVDFPASHFARATLTIEVGKSLWKAEASGRREMLLPDITKELEVRLLETTSEIALDWGTWQTINIQLRTANYKTGSLEFVINLSRREAAETDAAVLRLRGAARTFLNTMLSEYLLDPSLVSINTSIARY